MISLSDLFLSKGNDTNIPGRHLSNLDSGWKIGLTLAYSLILFLSLVGNSVILHILRKNPSLRTATNLFMASVSVANLLINFTHHPVVILHIHIGRVWIGGQMGKLLCVMVRYCRSVFYLTSIISLVLVSIDRYLCVVHPLKESFTSRHTKKLLALTWLSSPAMTISVAFKAEIEKFGKQFVCHVESQGKDVLVNYVVFSFLAAFAIPLLIMLALYATIGYKLWSHNRPQNRVSNHRDYLVRKRVTIAMAAIVTSFAVCWFPLQVFILLLLNAKGSDEDQSDKRGYRVLVLLSGCSTALIPWLNIAFGQTMRQHTKNIFRRYFFFGIRGCRTNQISVTSSTVQSIKEE